MKDVTLTEVNRRLLELDDKFSTIYPQFKKIELEYINKQDEIMLQVASQYASQPLRDTALRRILLTDHNKLWTDYNTMAVEVKVIEVRLRNLQQISRNMISQNFTGE